MLAVKIDNIVNARPQTGLALADIVYVLPVEGGLSRFCAIFSSHVPPVVGPVRSARDDDLQLIRQFGRRVRVLRSTAPAAAGGGAGPHRRSLRRAGWRLLPGQPAGRPVQPVRPDQPAARRGPRREHPRDIGFRFGPAPAGGTATASRSVAYPAASFTFRWSQRKGRWLVWMDGAPAMTTDSGQLGAPTVVIQYTRVGSSRFREWGGPAPYAYSTGAGRAVVLRDGNVWQAHWSRPHASHGTTFTTGSGQRMTFARGPVWVVLAYG